MLKISNLSVEYGTFKALENVSFEVSEGQWIMVIGPNGAGKSTVVKAVSYTHLSGNCANNVSRTKSLESRLLHPK